jgi:hypothetical protein
MSNNNAEISYLLDVNTTKATIGVNRYIASVQQGLSITKRFCGNEDISKGITTIQHAITLTQTLIRLQTIAKLASGPAGWAMLGVGVGASVASGYTLYESLAGSGDM